MLTISRRFFANIKLYNAFCFRFILTNYFRLYYKYRHSSVHLLSLPIIGFHLLEMSAIYQRADELYAEDKMQELFIYLHEIKEESSNLAQPDFLWRLARANYQAAKIMIRCKKKKDIFETIQKCYPKIIEYGSYNAVSDDKDLAKISINKTDNPPKDIEKIIENLYKQGLSYAKAAVFLNDTSSSAHKWLGVMTNCNLAYTSLQAQIGISFQIKEEFEKAIELNPNDPTLYYCLGCWHTEISKLSWYAKSLAKLLGPGKVFTSTYQDALNEFLKAEQIQPMFFADNLYMIASSYKELGQKERAKTYCQKLLTEYAVKTLEDKEVVEKTKQLLKTL